MAIGDDSGMGGAAAGRGTAGRGEPLDQADIDAVLAAATDPNYDAASDASTTSTLAPPGGNGATGAEPRLFWASLDEPEAEAGLEEPRNLSIVMDIPLEVSVELGRKRMSIRDILDLGAGAIVELDKIAGEPVDLLVNGRLVARGEVVVIEDNFGVRITEIVDAAARAAGAAGNPPE